MPRTPRAHVLVDAPFHVMMRGNHGCLVFHNDADRRRYLSMVTRAKRKYAFKLYHYVLMDNHVHLMMHAKIPDNLSKAMQAINWKYSTYYKERYGDERQGHLWGDRFKSIEIKTDEQLLTTGIYIELNPVRAKIIEDAAKYRWSSYCYYGYGLANDLVDEDPFYSNLGFSSHERQEKYRSLTAMWQMITPIKGAGR